MVVKVEDEVLEEEEVVEDDGGGGGSVLEVEVGGGPPDIIVTLTGPGCPSEGRNRVVEYAKALLHADLNENMHITYCTDEMYFCNITNAEL